MFRALSTLVFSAAAAAPARRRRSTGWWPGSRNGGLDATQPFILIANTENRAGQARITVLPNVPTTQLIPEPTVIPLPANSRTTVLRAGINGPYGVLVTSIGASPVQIVVESAVYRSAGGVIWSAGSNALATPVVP